MTTYAIAILKLPATHALSATVVGGLATAIFALLGGWLSDRFGRRPVMLIPRIALAVVTWPAFWLVTTRPSAGTLYVAVIALAGLTGISAAAKQPTSACGAPLWMKMVAARAGMSELGDGRPPQA